MKILNIDEKQEELKDKVKYKIASFCKLYKIPLPKNWSYEEVKKVSDIINNYKFNHCPFCGREKKGGFNSVICRCEVDKLVYEEF